MARINVNPTRMELKKLKARLKTAIRGHKLLKDKTDEMVRRFSVVVRENKCMRDEVENDVVAVLKQFAVARSFLSTEEIELAFAIPSVTVDLDYGTKNIMSVSVPELRLKESRSEPAVSLFVCGNDERGGFIGRSRRESARQIG